MKTQEVRNPLLKLQMGGIAVVLLSFGAVAALMAVMPSVAAVSPAPTFARALSVNEPEPPFRDRCEQCAVVTFIREIEPLEHGIQPGVGSRTTKDLRNAMAEESARRYEITIRMRDGSTHVIEQARPANWRVNERLILIGGADARNES
ncbi:MAG: hypothetical protein NTW45_13270 [Rhodocyclales bacterium]|nr:hypothetical protein [Rhodocyclales bacterium]